MLKRGDSAVALASKGPRKAAWAWVIAVLFLPAFLGLAQYWALRSDRNSAEIAAEAELVKPVPKRDAWGVLGTIRLEQGRIADALPLLQKAAALEKAGGHDTRDSLSLVKANLEGAAAGIPGASLQAAAADLEQAQVLAESLPKGKRAATWFRAGMFWEDLGRKQEAVRALRKAVSLQSDDWVDLGGGVRYKSAGLSAYYQKMLAGALEE